MQISMRTMEIETYLSHRECYHLVLLIYGMKQKDLKHKDPYSLLLINIK